MIASIILLLIVVVIVGFSIRSLWKKHKNGGGCCGCDGGSCGCCGCHTETTAPKATDKK